MFGLRKLTASDLETYEGRIRIIYREKDSVTNNLDGQYILHDPFKTDDVTLIRYDKKTQNITFQRADGRHETVKAILIYAI